MVRWYHAIFSAYGYWLPNDPRGSWSDFVRSWELFRAGGPATTVSERRSYAHDPHDVRLRREAKQRLKFPPARFDATCRASIAAGFNFACETDGISLYACAIGHDHVHIVSPRDDRRTIERIVAVLKARASHRMSEDRTHPMGRHRLPNGELPTAWAKSCWSVFINDEAQLRNAIEYVDRHPMKEGLPRQNWSFLIPV